MIRVIIADDHDVIREGVKRILADQADIEVIAEARDGQGLLTLLQQQPCDVVVLDLAMPGRGGLEALKQLKGEYPKLPVLVLSMHPESQYAVRVVKAGASGYLTKANVSSQLVEALRKAAGGGRYITPSVAELLAGDIGDDDDGMLHKKLSDREFQVLRLIGAGKTVSEIAKELSLSVQTVSTYRAHILDKMGLDTTAQITRYAIEHQLID